MLNPAAQPTTEQRWMVDRRTGRPEKIVVSHVPDSQVVEPPVLAR